jgi:hypothetical protein
VLLGLLLVVVATVVWTWQTRRLVVASPRARLPFVGWPPNKPKHVMLLNSLALFVTAVGASLVAKDADGYFDVWLVALCWLIVAGVGVLLPMATHNRRLPALRRPFVIG